LEFNVPFQHKYGYIRDEEEDVTTATGNAYRKFREIRTCGL